tara:strand:- start:560 stop:1435 length:876 start_codon:yes stop_codon:yes gene_type:complete
MSFVSNILGGGSRPSAPSSGGGAPSTTTSFVREAPGIEERKIELMDLARQVAQKPVNIPAIQVSPFTALEQQGLTAAGTTGVGGQTTTAGIGQLLGAATPIGQQQIQQYFNPYQDFVTDEITRQAQIAQNRLGQQAIRAGAFGGGREGVAQAELQARALEEIGKSRARGFDTALAAAQDQQRVGLSAGQQLLGAGQQQQSMAQQDINQLIGAGGLQRQLAQQALDAQRQTQLQQSFEPFQRAEFLSNIYAAGPKSQSGITATTAPQPSPLAQAVGTGLGAFTAFQGIQQGN